MARAALLAMFVALVSVAAGCGDEAVPAPSGPDETDPGPLPYQKLSDYGFFVGDPEGIPVQIVCT